MIKPKYVLTLIIFLAVVLRIVAINQSLWLDEAIGALVVKDQNYSQIMSVFPKSDNHPPLYYLGLKAWSDIFGYSEVALRSLSLLLGIGTIIFTYKIALKLVKKKEKISQKIGLFSALLLATAPLHIYYSQEARMYMMAAFFATAAIYYFTNILRKTPQTLNWILLSLSITALVFTDYVPIFFIPVLWVYALYRRQNRQWWIKFITSHLPLLILGLLWLPMLLIQVERGRWLLQTLPAWQDVAGGATFRQAALVWTKFLLGRISLINKPIYYGLIIIASIPVIFSGIYALKGKRVNDIPILIYLWLLLPLTLGFLVSFWFPAFIYFRYIFVLPAFYLVMALGVFSLKSKNSRIILAGVLIAINLLGWFIYIGDSKQQRENWKQAVLFIESHKQANELVLFKFPEPFAPYKWYANDLNAAQGATDSISANKAQTLLRTQKLIKDKSGIYLFEYLGELSDPTNYVLESVKNNNFKENDIYDFNGVGHVIYLTK